MLIIVDDDTSIIYIVGTNYYTGKNGKKRFCVLLNR